jgi:Helix-turn-helix domain
MKPTTPSVTSQQRARDAIGMSSNFEVGKREPMLLTPEEAAEVLKRPVGTISRWRAEGVGPRYFKVGGRIRYDLGDLLAYLNECGHVPSVRA